MAITDTNLRRRRLRARIGACAACALMLCSGFAIAAPRKPSATTPRQAAIRFLTQAASGQGGKVTVTVKRSVAKLPACSDPHPFIPGGRRRLLGQVTVGVHCANGSTRYLQAEIAVTSDYWVAAHGIPVGTTVTRKMLVARSGNLARLPQDVILDPSQAVGKVTTTRLQAGASIMQTELRAPRLVRAGQVVSTEAVGHDFRITRKGTALQSGAKGDTISVRTSNGRIIRGLIVGPAVVRINL